MAGSGDGQAAAMRRLKKEMLKHLKEPPNGIHFVLDDEKSNVAHALVIGPPGTPYEGGFFYFYITVPPNYPFSPPTFQLMTTGNNQVRFNPNLYRSGKVCLSILGTWPGPGWTANYTLESVLLSIQSLLNEKPYYNEPGYKPSKDSEPASQRYTDYIRFVTMSVGVLGMMENCYQDSKGLPPKLRNIMREVFASKVDFYMATILQNEENNNNTRYNYATLKPRLESLIRRYGPDKNAKKEDEVKNGDKRSASEDTEEEEESSSTQKKSKKK